MEVRIITDREQWNNFLRSQPHGYLHQSYEWGELNRYPGSMAQGGCSAACLPPCQTQKEHGGTSRVGLASARPLLQVVLQVPFLALLP
jgi:hypothetical protein